MSETKTSEMIEKRYRHASLWLKYARANGVRTRVCGTGRRAELQVRDRRRFLSDDQRTEMSKYRREMTTLATSLDQFALSGRVIVIDSDILQARIVLAADNATLPDSTEGLPVYRCSELAALMTRPPKPEQLHHLHEVKMVFDGQVVTDAEDTDARDTAVDGYDALDLQDLEAMEMIETVEAIR